MMDLPKLELQDFERRSRDSLRDNLVTEDEEATNLIWSVSLRKILLVILALIVLAFGAGIAIGHFAVPHSHDQGSSDGVFLEGVSRDIIREADPTITDFILTEFNASHLENYKNDLRNLSDEGCAERLRQFWESCGLDVAFITPHDVPVQYVDTNVPKHTKRRQFLTSVGDTGEVAKTYGSRLDIILTALGYTITGLQDLEAEMSESPLVETPETRVPTAEQTQTRQTIYNVFGVIRGQVEPDRYVMIGSYRTKEAELTVGTATMMELARILGKLVKQGRWRPRRTVVFCSWDNYTHDNLNIDGAQEWIKENMEILAFRSVAYISLDDATVKGNNSVVISGTPPVFSALCTAAHTVFDVTSEGQVVELGVERTGCRSFQRAGLTCAGFSYQADVILQATDSDNATGEDDGTNTHQADLKLRATIGKMSGELLRDLADSKILPFNMSEYATILRNYTYRFENNATAEIQKHQLNLSTLHRAVSLYADEAEAFHGTLANINRNNPLDVRRVNDQMMQIGQMFHDPGASPKEQQSRYVLGSYNCVSFPGLDDALYKIRKEETTETIQELQKQFSLLVVTIQTATNSLKYTADGFIRNNR